MRELYNTKNLILQNSEEILLEIKLRKYMDEKINFNIWREVYEHIYETVDVEGNLRKNNWKSCFSYCGKIYMLIGIENTIMTGELSATLICLSGVLSSIIFLRIIS